MEENKTFNFQLTHDTAVLLYNSPLSSDPKRDINTFLIDQTAQFVNDPQYEKTKAQRVLAKTLASNILRQQTERNTIDASSSLSNLILSTAETIPVSTVGLSITLRKTQLLEKTSV